MNEENFSFDDAIDKMFQNRKLPLKERLEKLFLYNGNTIHETNNDYIKLIFSRMINDALKDEQLLQDIFSDRNKNPVWNYTVKEGQGIVIEPINLNPDAIRKIGKLLSDAHNNYNTPLS